MDILSLGNLPIINTVCRWTLPDKQLCSPSSIMHQILFCIVDPSGLQKDSAGLYWFYSAGATTLIAVSLLAYHALYR